MVVSKSVADGRQAYLEKIGDLRLRTVPVPTPGPGEVLVQIEVSLTCGTDLKTYRRGHSRLPVPGPIGHEGTGRVVAVGPDVVGFQPGQAVVWLPTAPCGDCTYCRWGLANHCTTLMEDVVLGVHGDYVLLPTKVVRQHLFHRPGGMAPAAAALLEPLACVMRGWARVAGLPNLMRRGEPLRTLVVGGGPIGLMHVAVAAARGPVACVGARGRRGILARKLGATCVVPDHLSAADEALASIGLPSGRFDLAIDCTGTPGVWEQLPQTVRPGGAALLFGGLASGSTVPFAATPIHYDEVTLLGSFHYTTADVVQAMALLQERHHDLSAIITHWAPLSRVAQVFAHLDGGLTRGEDGGFTGGKVALLPDPAAALPLLGYEREAFLP